MQSLRRVALRSAAAATRAVAVKPQTTVFLARAVQAAEIRSVVLPAVRCFSQSSRLAEEQQNQAPEASSQSGANGEETPHAVFVRNLVFDAGESHLEEAFSKFGEVTKVAVARDARGLSRGYGFIWYRDEESVLKAVEETNGSFWHGRRIQSQVREKKAGGERAYNKEPTRSLYIGNIPYETTDAELNKLFRDLDGVTDIRVAVDRTTGWPRGFAHADFKTIEQATSAVEKLRDVTIAGRSLRVDYAQSAKTWDKNPAEQRNNTHITEDNSFVSN